MWITKTSINQPVFATMVMVALMVLGIISYQNLNVEQLPEIDPPVVVVSVQYPGASPEAVENDITKRIEEAANTVSGVKMIRSSSYEGRSDNAIEFELNVNMDKAIQDVRDKIAQVRPNFPKDAKDPFIVRGDTDNTQPIAYYSVASGSRSLRDLSTLADQIIVKRLQSVQGVGRVKMDGAVARQVVINIDPPRLAAQRIGVDEVMAAIRDTNQDLPAGSISHDASERLVRIEGKMKDPRAFGKIIVARRGNVPVYLEQVATVLDGEREETSISRVNGQRAIVLSVVRVQDANVVKVGDGIREAIENVKKSLPPDVDVRMIYSNSDWVKASLSRVKSTIVEGAALTILIVFLFLHSWRSTVITGLTLPISVIATFIAMNAFGFTLNFMTLMALSLCIGLLIDDAIVVRENIVRHVDMGKDHRSAARDGTQEIGLAVMATTFAIVAVFVPVAFMKGIIGRFFLQFGITVTVAVLVSLFVSFTLDPMLSSVWRDPSENRFRRFPWLGRVMARIEHGIERLHRIYGAVLEWALRWRKTTLAAAFAVFVGSFFLVPMIGTEFVPQTDQGFTTLKFKTPVGSSLAYTDDKMRQVEQALKSFKEIELVNTTVGMDEGHNYASLDLRLTDAKQTHRKPQQEVEKAIRERLKSIPGIELSVGWNKPIFISILGPDADKLKQVVDHVMTKIAAIKGVTDLDNSMAGANPTVTVKVHNELASDLGVSLQQVGNALRPFLAGDTVSYWLAPDGQNYEVNVQLPKSGRQKIADLAELQLASSRLDADGRPLMVPLRQIVDFVPS
ncbi:efflux RND transporter permease subunit, partial [Oxalobacteraceae bacterium OM1]